IAVIGEKPFANQHLVETVLQYVAQRAAGELERQLADEALHESEALFRSYYELGLIGMAITSLEKGWIQCNSCLCSMLGYSQEELSNKSWVDLTYPDDLATAEAYFQGVLRGEIDGYQMEKRFIRKDGVIVQTDLSVRCVRNEDGSPRHFVAMIKDITRQKREEKLAAARLYLIEYSLSHTLDELLTETLDQIEDLTGSLIGFFHLLQEDQRTLTLHAWSTRTAKDFCKAEGSGSHYDIEKAGVWVDCILQRQPVIHNDYASLPHRKGMPPGHATVIRELAVPIFRSDKIMGILGIGNKDTEYTEEDVQIASRFADLAWDIAERRQMQDSLNESNDLITIAFNSAPIMITVSSIEDGTYLDVNQQFLNISGFSREEVIGKTSVELGWISEADRMQLKESIQQQGRIHGQEFTRHSKSGQTRLCKYWGEILSVAGQKRLLSIALDITEQHKAEQHLRQAQKMESIGSLAGGVAHDFNNLLTVIMGHVHLGLMESDTNHPVCERLTEIMKTAERSADLTRQLLAFARKQAIAPKDIDLNEVIDGMLKMLLRLIGEDIQLTWQPAPDLWHIKADPSQIDQILANLCVNARDAINGTGRITIETRNNAVDSSYCEENPEAVPGDYVHLIVSDDGSGMDKETMTRVFEPFFTTKGVGEGTGLGLATVYGIVKQNNGFINIYSEPGKGTTFTIHLPRLEEKSQKAPTEAKSAPLPKGQETILLVEDEPAILQITSLLLGKQGYTLLTAGTPDEAMRLANEYAGEINLLITDVIMPEMNGKELANRLQSLNPQLKCLYMSGYTADAIAQHGVLDEGIYFIQKPFSLPNLSTKVREVLDSKPETT
ncbi:MAG: PAS domain S-box protein, partial [Desulfuromonadaceae bacterium]|nr:PAS domain S-box protein [Desulfuromonadaceae bacterium]